MWVATATRVPLFREHDRAVDGLDRSERLRIRHPFIEFQQLANTVRGQCVALNLIAENLS